MKVSVICVSDRPERLPLLVWSLVAQTHDEWELLVLDQSGQSPGVMRHLQDQDGCLTVPEKFRERIRVKSIERVGDWGQTAKEIAAQSLANGDVLMFPADDAYYVPSALADMVASIEAGNDLALCGWLYDLCGYVPMAPTPAVGHVDVGGFMVSRQAFLEHGWPSKGQTGDGELVVSLAAGGRVGRVPKILYVKS